jgi:hypothetical protein
MDDATWERPWGKAEVGGLYKFGKAVITIARSPRYVLQ